MELLRSSVLPDADQASGDVRRYPGWLRRDVAELAQEALRAPHISTLRDCAAREAVDGNLRPRRLLAGRGDSYPRALAVVNGSLTTARSLLVS